MTGNRGQINFDFAVGVSIVIVAVILAISFVPDVFGGVTTGGQQSDEVVADRVAENLVDGSLEDPTDPGAVDFGCVYALFYGSGSCGFTSSLEANLPEVENRQVNVTVERAGELQCWDGSIRDHESAPGSCEELFDGDDPANAEQLGSARRAASLDGVQVEIMVRVW